MRVNLKSEVPYGPTLFRQTNQWVCTLGWDDRQNGQEFADPEGVRRRSATTESRVAIPQRFHPERRGGIKQRSKPFFMSRLGFDDSDVFFSHMT
jgi:hypothetical protein